MYFFILNKTKILNNYTLTFAQSQIIYANFIDLVGAILVIT